MSAETASSWLKDRGCGTVPHGHGSHTLQVAVTCGYGNGRKIIGGLETK